MSPEAPEKTATINELKEYKKRLPGNDEELNGFVNLIRKVPEEVLTSIGIIGKPELLLI